MAAITYNDHPADANPAAGDYFPFWDVTAGAAHRATRAELVGATLTGGGTITTGGFTLVVPSSGTAMLLGAVQTASGAKTFTGGVFLETGALVLANSLALQATRTGGTNAPVIRLNSADNLEVGTGVPAGSYISFAPGGNRKMTLTADDGYLGVGLNNTPSTIVHTVENSAGDSELRVENTNAGTAARAIVRVASDGGYTQGGAIIKHSLAHATFPNGFRVINNEGDLILSTDGVDVTITDAGAIGIGNATPNASAILDLTSTTRALLVPRMTAVQRNNIANKTNGMIVYNTTANILECYENGSWVDL